MEAKMVVKINYKFLILLITICFLINLVYAQTPISSSLKISSEKSVYTLGETIKIYADVENIRDYTVNTNLQTILRDEKGEYPLAVIPFEFVLRQNETKKILLYDILVTENMISDFYTVDVELVFNNEKITKKSLQFEIIGTLKEMVLDVNVCKDSSCKEKSKMFIKDDKICFDYNSDVKNLEMKATLIYPDKTTEQITLPNSIKPGQIGTYELEVIAEKQDYKTVIKKEQFGVIEKNVEIREVSFKEANYFWYILIGIMLVLIIVAIVIWIYYKKKRVKEVIIK